MLNVESRLERRQGGLAMRAPPKTILIATDGTPRSAAALAAALHLDGTALLVMGTQEARRLLREGRESVADDVTRHAYGPLLLVPEQIRVSGHRERRGRERAAEPALR
jgi:hypothetical protein